jgi:hypothetical protein
MNKIDQRHKAQGLKVSGTGSRRSFVPVMALAILFVVFLQNVQPAWGQPQGVPPPKPGPGPIRVFIDAPPMDPGSLIKGQPFAVLVPDTHEAQVVIRITLEPAQGGDAYKIALTGQHEFEGMRDVLPYVPEPGRKPDEIQGALGQLVQLGLMRFVARTPLGGRVRINLMDQVSPTAVVDPWNFWVFSLNATSFLNGQESYRSQMWFASFSAVRITPEWKIRLALNGTYEKDHYDYQDYIYDSSLNSQSVTGLVVRSLDDHWSVGSYFSVHGSSFSNTKLDFRLSPAVEYDIFPYSESTKRQLRVLYRLGFQRVRYIDETIFDKTAETLFQQELSGTLELKRPWGTVSTTLSGSNYFNDFSKYRLELNGEVSVRIFQGLSFNIEGGASWIHDQLNLAKAGASIEDVLLQRKQIATSYDYFFMLGFSYSFGSIRSNVVNPRFGSSGGGGFSMRISM